MTRLLLTLFTLLALNLFGCADDPTVPDNPDAPVEPDVPVDPDAPGDAAAVLERLELSGTTTMVPGLTAQVMVEAFDTNGAPMATPATTWSSSAPAIVGVSATGEVTAYAVGAGIISARSGSVTAWLRVAVYEGIPVVARVELQPDGELVLSPGATSQLLVFAYDALDNALDGRVITWTNTDPAVATIGPGGQLTAVAAGTTTITVHCEGVTDSISVRIRIPAARIQLSSAQATIDVAEQLQLTAQLFDAADQPLQDVVTWSSDHPEHASVDANGLITGHAEGGAIITATSGAATATMIVYVARWTERSLLSVNGAPAPATMYAYTTNLGGIDRQFVMQAADGVLAIRALDGRYELMVFGPVFLDDEEVGFATHTSVGTMRWDGAQQRFQFTADAPFGGRSFTGRYVDDQLEITYQPDPSGAPATLMFAGG